MKTDKIVIVGGGSAGWMTAASMIKAFPEKDISVIESPDVPSIGVGESTLGQIKRWTRFIGLDEKDFMPFTDATYKLSIQFTDFYNKDSGSFHYPFGWPVKDEDTEESSLQRWQVARVYHPESPETDMVNLFFPAAQLWSRNKFHENKDGSLGNFNSEDFVAYHFDAVKFGVWLRDRYCIPRGVKHVAKHVQNIHTGDSGVESLEFSDGTSITADLYIDCTGFKSMILEGALGVPFIEYGDMLPNNSAWACQIPYRDKYKELQPFTNCTAIENGWCWNIPLWSRIGTGYNYSDKYISDEDALEQFKNYLCSDKMVVPRTREELESYTFRNLKTRVGIHDRIFVKNVVAIGLSAGFIEPLESNGLLSVHEFLFHLIDIMDRGEITQFDRTWFNTEARDMFNAFAKFVAMHYSMSNRSDTKYWQDVMDRDYTEERGGEWRESFIPRTAAFYNAQRNFYNIWENHNELDGIQYIAAGMKYRPMFRHRGKDFAYANSQYDIEKNSKEMYKFWKERMKIWASVAEQAPHMVDYMKRTFYSDMDHTTS